MKNFRAGNTSRAMAGDRCRLLYADGETARLAAITSRGRFSRRRAFTKLSTTPLARPCRSPPDVRQPRRILLFNRARLLIEEHYDDII